MKRLLKELERINAAKKRAKEQLTAIIGENIGVVIYTDTASTEPKIGVYTDKSPFAIKFIMHENGCFIQDLSQSVVEVIYSDLTAHIVDICDILTQEFCSDSAQTPEKRLLDEALAALVELHESLEANEPNREPNTNNTSPDNILLNNTLNLIYQHNSTLNTKLTR